ncbi:28S ribosomal protein S29, mitochondrial isoform X1 [Osmia bicornis bicornis]|uniref:28S ribosomal protein S29, mitochondrial isoform X1 n=1 Tax=Osmia bicornis bicornis TaxID=1437191 RepID=UPI0010F78D54|nr:28S ribosomal protein S29, mitochondrial isoform X1 [Osmia bicornis bicornis]
MISYTSTFIFKVQFSLCSVFSKLRIIGGRRTVITAAVKEVQDIDIAPFRVLESYPPNHNARHLNRIYTVPSDVTKLLRNELPKETVKRVDIFREFGILVRKPAIELISYLEQTDYTKPVNRYVLYGKTGVGKSTTLVHLVHYGLARQFIVIHLPWICNWYKFPKDIAESPLIPGQLDLPQNAAIWLKYFSTLNQLTLSKFDLKVSKDYNWSQRESTKAGESLISLIEFGIQRTKFACGVVSALIDELKAASTAGKCRTLVVIDGFNSFISNSTSIRDETRKYVPPERISLTAPFYNSAEYNWCNGAVILSVDIRATRDRTESIYPKYLLDKKGFEHLDPFLPMNVENYTVDEFKNIVEYYEDRKWIRKFSPQGQREIELLTNKNPLDVWVRCKPL